MKYKISYHAKLMCEANRISRDGECWWVFKHIVGAAKYPSQIEAQRKRKTGLKKRNLQNAL